MPSGALTLGRGNCAPQVWRAQVSGGPTTGTWTRVTQPIGSRLRGALD